MKKSLLLYSLFIIYYLLFCLFITPETRGQNLVPNPSFEDTTACPYDYCQIHRAIGWTSWGYTPDYLNACAMNANPWSQVSTPDNGWGIQSPASGNAYIAQYTFSSSILVREYSGIKLLNPLTVGQKYFASVKVSLADDTKYATNKLGLLFTTNSYAKDTSNCNQDLPLIPPNYAQVFSDSIITDKINWTTISGSFIADSAYEYIVLGNFFDNDNTDTIKFNNGCCSAIYFFDDVSVVADTSSDTTNINELNSKNIFSVYPNPANDFIKILIYKNFPATLKIYDLLGMEMLTQKFDKNENVINLSSLSAGIYFISISLPSQSFTNKLILTR